MLFRCDIDTERKIVFVVIDGDLDDETLISLDDEFRSNPEIKGTYDQVLDLRKARGPAVSSEAVRELARREPFFDPTARRAVVVETALGFGLARLYQGAREDRAGDIRVFRDMDEATRWLSERRR
jgi:hypothetical protein